MAWTALRSQFESRANLGQWWRWEAALEEMAAYYSVPSSFRATALREFRGGVENLIALSPALHLIGGDGNAAADDEEFSEPTIFPFTISRQRHELSPHECRALHEALSQDVSHIVGRSRADRDIAARRCLIGQPVDTRHYDVMDRIRHHHLAGR